MRGDWIPAAQSHVRPDFTTGKCPGRSSTWWHRGRSLRRKDRKYKFHSGNPVFWCRHVSPKSIPSLCMYACMYVGMYVCMAPLFHAEIFAFVLWVLHPSHVWNFITHTVCCELIFSCCILTQAPNLCRRSGAYQEQHFRRIQWMSGSSSTQKNMNIYIYYILNSIFDCWYLQCH